MAKQYWHKEEQEEVDKLIESGITIAKLKEQYKQPDWCNYPDALDGVLGCWSLNNNTQNGLRTKICEDFCKTCPKWKKIKTI